MDYLKPWIRGIDSYVPGATIPGKIKLASNENNYGPSPHVAEALSSSLGSLHLYPYREKQLTEKIASYVGLSPENIVLSNGSDESIDMILKVFRGPCFSFNPTYSEYRIFSSVLGEKYFDSDLEPDFSFDEKRFIKASGEASILFICSPNNPTGGTISEDQLVEILDLGKVTVLDEAYVEFAEKSLTSLVSEYSNLIVLRTFSKAFALAGLRVGYMAASPDLVETFMKVKAPFSVNSLGIEAAMAALDDVSYMQSCVEKIKKDRALLFSALEERYRPIPSESNFILFDVSPAKSGDVYKRTLDEGFILRDFGQIKGFNGQYLRVTVGTEDQNKAYISSLENQTAGP